MLSIIIPTYNSEKTIKKCINSILNISKIKYEIIIIDDGSSDNTPTINDSYSDKYNNIYSFHQKHHGVSVARNNGINKSIGSTICFIDSDDFINAHNLEIIIQEYNKRNVDLIIPNIKLNKQTLGIKSSYKYSNAKEFCKNNYPLYGNEIVQIIGNKLYNAHIIKKHNITFPINITMGEDFIFNLKFLLFTRNITQTNIIYYYYFIHNYSVSNRFELNPIRNKLSILQFVKKVYKKYNLSTKALNWLKLKAAYSILLNTLKLKSNQMKYLSYNRSLIYKYNLIPNKTYPYKKLESYTLQFIVQSCPLLILFLILKCINIIRKIIIYHEL